MEKHNAEAEARAQELARRAALLEVERSSPWLMMLLPALAYAYTLKV